MCQPSISDLLFDDNRLLLCTKCNLPFLSLNKKWRSECSNLTESQLFQCMLTHSASNVENKCSDGTESHNRSVSDLPVYSLQCRVQILLHVEQWGSTGRFLYGVRQSDDPAIISEPLLSLNKKLNTKIYHFFLQNKGSDIVEQLLGITSSIFKMRFSRMFSLARDTRSLSPT